MKLTVEIKDNMMHYSYEIGSSKHNSSKHLSADSLVRFVNLLGELSKHYEYEDKVWERESIARAWLEKKCDKEGAE